MKILPDKLKMRSAYEAARPVLQSILYNIEKKLRSSLSLSSMPSFKSRIKEFDSYYRKWQRLRTEGAIEELPLLSDILGIRVICAFLEDIALVERQILSAFTVIEIERKGADQTFKEFGYESIHMLIELPQEVIVECFPEGLLPEQYRGLLCEIQIRTILQDAWASVEHELVYKSEFSPFDLPLRRKLASMNASLCLADIIFQEIRDYQNKLNRELGLRRSSFYGKADELSRPSLPDKAESTTLFSPSPFVRGTIDDLILEAIHAHNTGEIERAIEIYTRIIEAEPAPHAIVLSVIFKHRGMAYFACDNFDQALRDFELSVEANNTNFTSFYYMGIVLSIINRDSEAIDAFCRSLALNEYQSHVYYRRALAYYKLSDYEEALNDLASARKLGLDSADCRSLHEKLIEKLDMAL